MATTPTTPGKPQQAVLSPRELMDKLVDIVMTHANEQLIGVGSRLVGVLLDATDGTLGAQLTFKRIKSGNLLKENSYAYIHLASNCLHSAIRAEVADLLGIKRTLSTSASLSLVSMEEMDDKVAFEAVSRPFEMQYASQLATLNVRLGALLQRDILRIGQNPFRPEMFLSTLSQAWREFEPDTEAHGLVVALLKPSLLFDFAPMYDALCEALVKKGARPKALAIKKSEGANSLQAERARSEAALAQQLRKFLGGGGADFDADIPLIPDLPAMPASGGGWRPSAAQGFESPMAEVMHGEKAARAAVMPGVVPAPGFAGQGGHSSEVRQAGGFSAPGGQGFSGHSAAGFVGQPVPGFVGQPAQGFVGQPAQGFVGQPLHGYVGQLVGGSAAQSLQAFVGQPGQGIGGGNGGGMRLQAGASMVSAGAVMAALGQAGFGAGPAPLLDMVRTLQANMPDHFAATPSAPGQVHGADVFYLPRLKAGIPQGSLSRGDESTIDLLSKVFETVFLDPNIPQEVRELLQYLQIPVLKAALSDKNFFFEEAHPARRMIDMISRVGLDASKSDHPLFQAMQRSVDKVGAQAGSDAEVFASAVAELEEQIRADEAAAANAIAEPIAQALKQEKVFAATRSARSAVAVRVSSGEVVAVLETFLEQKWTSVLTVAYSVEEEKPGAVGNATKTMDDLIWSVKPKITVAERKSLIAKLPGLLATLNKWLDIIKWQDAERLQFFAELAECHASIVRAPLDISAERQLEIAVEVAQADAVRRLEKEQQASDAPDVAQEPAAISVETLERGMWLDFQQSDGSARKAKLAWVSPLRTLFIFSVSGRQESFSLPAEKLVAGFCAEKIKIVLSDGVVGRALADAMGGGAVNDSAAESAAA